MGMDVWGAGAIAILLYSGMASTESHDLGGGISDRGTYKLLMADSQVSFAWLERRSKLQNRTEMLTFGAIGKSGLRAISVINFCYTIVSDARVTRS